MYKHTHHVLTKSHQTTPDLFRFENLSKVENKLLPHSFQQPHVLISAENPYHHQELKMSHGDLHQLLQNKGYDVSEIQGHYGSPEKSLMIKNPPQHSLKHFNELARKLGQDSIIHSTGDVHEMHYVNGEKAGKHIKGQGTEIHSQKPEDFYSTTPEGTHFAHNFDFGTLHTDSKFVKPYSHNMKKSENNDSFYMCKNEPKIHPLDHQNGGVRLIHYSPKQGMKEINPGSVGSGVDSRREKPEHPMSFYYLEGAKPESLVTSGAKSKYISSLGNKKLYDIGKDPEHIWSGLKTVADKRQMNPGAVTRDDFHQAIKEKGYHGTYNSKLDSDTMGKVIAMFHPMPVEEEQAMHPNDFSEASAVNHHINDKQRKVAGDFASVRGEHDGDFLHGLKQHFEKDNGN